MDDDNIDNGTDDGYNIDNGPGVVKTELRTLAS